MDPNQDGARSDSGLGGWGKGSAQDPWSGLQGNDPAAAGTPDVPPAPPIPEPAPRRRRRRPTSLRTSAVDSSSAALGERVVASPGSVNESEPTTSIINSPPVIGWMRAAGLAPPDGAEGEEAAASDGAAPSPESPAEATPAAKTPGRGRRRPSAAGTPGPPVSVEPEAPPVPEAAPAPDWVPASTALPTPDPAPVPSFIPSAAAGDAAAYEQTPPPGSGEPAHVYDESMRAYDETTHANDAPPAYASDSVGAEATEPVDPADAYMVPDAHDSTESRSAEPAYDPDPTAAYTAPAAHEPPPAYSVPAPDWPAPEAADSYAPEPALSSPSVPEPAPHTASYHPPSPVSSLGKEAVNDVPAVDTSKIDQSFDKFSEMATDSIKKLADNVSKRAGATDAADGSASTSGGTGDDAGKALPGPVVTLAEIFRDRPELGVIATFAAGLFLATLLKRLARR